MNAYQKAADCYYAEDSAVNAGSMRIKVAQLAAESKDYARAIEIFEAVSKSILDANKNVWSVKDYLFKALLCQLALSAKAQDMTPAEDALERYREMYPQIDGTREHKLIEVSKNTRNTPTHCTESMDTHACVFLVVTLALCQESLAAFKEDDGEAFQAAVRKYDEVVRLVSAHSQSPLPRSYFASHLLFACGYLAGLVCVARRTISRLRF